MRRGFTLSELLVAVAIIGLVMAGLLTLLVQGNQSYLTGSNQAEAQAVARATIERMTVDLREAGYDPRGTGFNAVEPAQATAFTLHFDWNASGASQPAPTVVDVPYTVGGVVTDVPRGERVTYTVDPAAGTLSRQESGVDAQPQVLLTAVQQAAVGQDCTGTQILNPPFFQYCDANSGTLASPVGAPGAIRSVIVSFRIGPQSQPPPSIWQAGAVTVTMSDRIRLRNR
jgi:prepilin-type N-terminal cleavage/methylation domain-containing protein